jgi:hypothetical protein
MNTATVQRVEFGLGSYEPTLRLVKANGLMSISWGEVPHEYEAQHELTAALNSSGIHAWLRSLYAANEDRLPLTSTLFGPSFGTWVDCPEDIGEMVVDIMTTFLRDAMEKIIPTPVSNDSHSWSTRV